jgi:hypothetical protein
MTAPASSYRPAVGAADLTVEVRLGITVAKRRGSDCTKTAARAPSRRHFGQQKRPVRAAQALKTAPWASPLHSVRVPTQPIRVACG